MKKAILVATLFVGIAAVSCKKDDDDPVTTAELMTSATWKIDTIGFDMDKNGEIDSPIPGGLEECELDNTLTFSADSTGVFDEGATKCDSADPQNTSFAWTLSENDKVLTITGDIPGELEGDVDILTLTNAEFVLSKEISSTFPVPFNGNLIVRLQK